MPKSDHGDLTVLAPDDYSHECGDRVFSQKPLTLRSTAKFVTAISEELQKATLTAAMGKFFDTELEGLDMMQTVNLFMDFFKAVPDALPRLITIMLTGSDDPDTVEYINDNLRLPAALRVVRVFVEQNEPKELVANFFEVRAALTEAMASAKK